MDIKRGDVVIAAAPGDDGKPRPALVVQADAFLPTHASVIVCPLSSHLIDAPLFRPTLASSPANGLIVPTQAMVDKVVSLKRERITQVIGQVTVEEMRQVDRALLVFLGLA